MISYFDNLWYFIRKKIPFGEGNPAFEGRLSYCEHDDTSMPTAFATIRLGRLNIKKIREKLGFK